MFLLLKKVHMFLRKGCVLKCFLLMCLLTKCVFSCNSGSVSNNRYKSKFELRQGFIEISVSISDTVSGQFAIDNGMFCTTIDSVFFYTKFDTSKFVYRGNPYKGISNDIREYTGNISLKICNRIVNIKRFMVRNCKKMGPVKIDGIIGEELFVGNVIYIDYDNQEIEIIDALIDSANYFKIKLHPPLGKKAFTTTNSKFVKVHCYDSNKKEIIGHLQFDLGCIGTDLFLKREYFNRLSSIKSASNGSALIYSFQKSNVETWILDSVKIGNISNRKILATTAFVLINQKNVDPLCMFTEGDGYLGLNILKRFNVIVNYKDNLLYIKPNREYYKSLE